MSGALVISAPAESVAASICLLDRQFPGSESHPRGGCRWCVYSPEQLNDSIAYFRIIGEWDGERFRAEHCRAYEELPEREQKRLTREAQAIPAVAPA